MAKAKIKVTTRRSTSSKVPQSHNAIAFIVMALFIAAIGLVVWFVQQPQDLRQRAEGNGETQITWQKKSDMLFPRSGMAATVRDGNIYVLGGRDNNQNRVGTVQEYHPAEDRWVQLADMPTGRSWLSAVTVDKKIYVIGGFNGRQSLNTVEQRDAQDDRWITRASMPTARFELGVATTDGKIYAIGGWDYSNRRYLNAVEEYDPATDTWTTKSPMPTARFSFGTAVVNNKIYAIGGASSVRTNVVEEYDPATDTWTTKSPMPTARVGFGTAVVNNKIYAIGGSKSIDPNNIEKIEKLNIVEEYDPATDQWRTLQSMPTIRSSIAVAAIGNKIYVMGGIANKNGVQGDTHDEDVSLVRFATVEEGTVTGSETYTPPAKSTAPYNISATPSCNGTTPSLAIAWEGKPNSDFGFWVDIADNPSFGGFSNKNVGDATKTDGNGFSNNFTLKTGKTYYVRIYNGEHSYKVPVNTPEKCTPEVYLPPSTREQCHVTIAVDNNRPKVGETVRATVTLGNSNLGYKFDRNTLYELPAPMPIGQPSSFNYHNNYGGMSSTPPTHTYTFPAQPGAHVLQFAAEAYDGQGNQRNDPFFCSGTATYTGQ